MRLVVVDEEYPSPTHLYGDVFAHTRIKEYLKYYPELLVIRPTARGGDYVYEGVTVACPGGYPAARERILQFGPTVVLVHFATREIIRQIILKLDLPYVIWVHGYEALAWYRRLFLLDIKSLRQFLSYVRSNWIQLFHFRSLVKRSNRFNRIHFVYVSHWMKRITQFDCAIRAKNHSIIPNPIDTEFFAATPKDVELRRHLLMIRPFDSKKYATDIVTETMLQLHRLGVLKSLQVTLYGRGSTRSRLFEIFHEFDNVSIHEGFLTQEEIRKLHGSHGVFLALTRQDSQGVSACEAMSSGLVVVSSNNTAVPEFITDGVSGILTRNNPKEVATKIAELVRDPELFSRISRRAPVAIHQKAALTSVAQQELRLIEQISAR